MRKNQTSKKPIVGGDALVILLSRCVTCNSSENSCDNISQSLSLPIKLTPKYSKTMAGLGKESNNQKHMVGIGIGDVLTILLSKGVW